MATFVTFGSFDKVDTNDKVFASAWSDNTNDLTTNHFSSSAQYITTSPTSSGQYFMEIYSTNPDTNPTPGPPSAVPATVAAPATNAEIINLAAF